MQIKDLFWLENILSNRKYIPIFIFNNTGFHRKNENQTKIQSVNSWTDKEEFDKLKQCILKPKTGKFYKDNVSQN